MRLEDEIVDRRKVDYGSSMIAWLEGSEYTAKMPRTREVSSTASSAEELRSPRPKASSKRKAKHMGRELRECGKRIRLYKR